MQYDFIPKFINYKTCKYLSIFENGKYHYLSKLHTFHTNLNMNLLKTKIKSSLHRFDTLKLIHIELSNVLLNTFTTKNKQQFLFTLSFYQHKHQIEKHTILKYKFNKLMNYVKRPKFLIDENFVENLTQIEIPKEAKNILSLTFSTS